MSSRAERRQFRILNRDFLARIIDVEVISSGGDTRAVLVRFAALMGGFSFLVAYLMVPRFAMSAWPHARLSRAAWSVEEFLLSATIAVSGFVAVMAWNSMFPDRRDSLILGLLPVGPGTLVLAKAAAMATVLGGAIIALNSFTGLTLPLALGEGFAGAIVRLTLWWPTLGLAGVFTFCCLLAIQGVASQVLPWRAFLRVSGPLQIAALFTVLAFFFATPSIEDRDAPGYIPSFWFTGIYHVLLGDADSRLEGFAERGVVAMAIVIPLATLVYLLAWNRNVRRIVESPEILPAHNPRLANLIFQWLAPAPFERAIVQFAARTLARSRQHRLLLALYGGFGASLIFAFVRGIVSNSHDRMRWDEVNGPFLLAGILLLACAVVGVRAVYALPITLPANWIFRITAVHRPAAYFAAVRRSLFTLAALPVWIAAALFYLSIWPHRPALEHMAILILLGIIMVERSLYQFRKIPFTCSWLPGGANRSMKTAVLVLVFVVFATIVMSIELGVLAKTARVVVLLGIFGVAAAFSRHRTVELAADPYNRLQFEDYPPLEINALDLAQDGAWSGDEAWVDAIDPHFGRSMARRSVRFVAAFAALLVAGTFYEQFSEWRDRATIARVGHLVDVGGRSLNLYCSGQGSPTVVFETNLGMPGLSWSFIQRMAATQTRACWYDRAGYGWSDPAPSSNYSDGIATDLHALLTKAGVPPPYVLVGHAMGSFHARVFRGRYPGEVAGMVLVDPMSEDLISDETELLEWARPAMLGIQRFFVRAGAFRLLAPVDGPAGIQGLMLQPKSITAAGQEVPLRIDAGLARRSGSFGDMPVLILTAGRPGGEESEELDVEPQRKVALHRQMAALSSKGRAVFLQGVGHQIPLEAPAAVIDGVRQVVEQVRAK